MFECHRAIEVDNWFNGDRPRLQPTWAGLIRLQFGLMGRECEQFDANESVRNYQKHSLGRSTGNERLMELLPLPSPSIQGWLYAEHSELPWLVSREEYKRYMASRREGLIRQEMEAHQPKTVVFYGLKYAEHWARIAQTRFHESGIPDVSVGRRDGISFAIVPHPSAHGITRNYFFNVGRILSSGRLASAVRPARSNAVQPKHISTEEDL